MKKVLPNGAYDFKALIENNFYYVDKTKIIEELLIKQNFGITLFPRPRRFGKSLFISMLDNFFNVEKKETNKNLFKNLYISKSWVYKDNLSKYPVINLDFKKLKSNTFESTLYNIKSIFADAYRKKEYIKEVLNNNEKEKFKRILEEKGSIDDYQYVLLNLSEWLERYYNEKVIILIDEYDTPIDTAYNNGYYRVMMDLIKPLFSNAFKGNNSLKLGILTGVLRISGESMFSSFNNLEVYDVVSKDYNDYFGFTEKETKELLEYYDLKLTREVKDYYDGYNFNGVSIYNPWSIINYAKSGELISYWIHTGSNTLIRKMLENLSEDNKIKIEGLILGGNIPFTYDPKMSYNRLQNSNDLNGILNLFLISGYLTLDCEKDNVKYLRIPNNEVREDFGNILEEIMFGMSLSKSFEALDFLDGLCNNNKEKAEASLNWLLENVSYHDSKEAFYHGYILSIFNTFLTNRNYIVTSNKEAGYGRADVIIMKKDKSVGFVVEFKLSKTIKDMEKISKEGLKQLKEKNYRELLEKEKMKTVYEYVFVFHGKKAIVR